MGYFYPNHESCELSGVEMDVRRGLPCGGKMLSILQGYVGHAVPIPMGSEGCLAPSA